MFVDKYMLMDPATEFLVTDSLEIQNGMVVLIESPHEKVHLNIGYNDPEIIFKAHQLNRWAEVSDVMVDLSNETIRFVGKYDDGMCMSRTHFFSDPWLVKIDSILQRSHVRGEARNSGS